MKKRWLRIVIFIVLLMLFPVLFVALRPAPSPLTFYFFDVGQGDAALIRTPDGDFLIDAGPDSSEEQLLVRLRALGVHRLRLMALTHADEDHVGGADLLMEHLEIEQLWIGSDSSFGEPMERVLQLARERQIPLSTPCAGETVHIGDAVFELFSPIPLSGFTGNNGSLVFRFSYMGIRALFMGDVNGEVEREMAKRFSHLLESDVYKVAHHGSSTGESQQLLYWIRPRFAVISCGEGNSYGHPHGQTLALLESAGAEILRTDRMGEIVLRYEDGKLVRAKNTLF